LPEQAAANSEEFHGLWWTHMVWGWAVFASIILVAGFVVSRGKRERVPRGLAFRIAEHIYLYVENMCLSIIGPQGEKYIPFVGTLFIFTLFSNLVGLLGFPAPTSSLNITLAQALIVFCYVQFEAIRVNGPFGYLKHFWGPVLFIGPLMFLIEVVSEFAKIISLSLRLYGNMFGEHEVTNTFANLVHWPDRMPLIGGLPVPVHAPLILLGIFTCLIQALVFAILPTIYLALMISHEDQEEVHVAHAH
jgi:F-type H+-transporting ATPase subunit a